jgi:uncharacterized membrane protein
MVYMIFIAFLLILYGLMCYLARETLWRLSVPERAQARVNRAAWDRVTRITGVIAIAIGVVILATVLR